MKEGFSIVIGDTRLSSLAQIVDAVLDQYEDSIGVKLNEVDVDQRRDAVRRLYDIGFFDMRNSVEAFCSRAQVTKVTVYAHLKRAIYATN